MTTVDLDEVVDDIADFGQILVLTQMVQHGKLCLYVQDQVLVIAHKFVTLRRKNARDCDEK